MRLLLSWLLKRMTHYIKTAHSCLMRCPSICLDRLCQPAQPLHTWTDANARSTLTPFQVASHTATFSFLPSCRDCSLCTYPCFLCAYPFNSHCLLKQSNCHCHSAFVCSRMCF